jgi:hypothetical protein
MFDRFRQIIGEAIEQATTQSPQSRDSSPLSIPHPEEPMNAAATLENTSVHATVIRWLQDWSVPSRYWDYWEKAIDIEVHESYPASLISMGITQDTPAATWEAGGRRHLAVKPQWLNPGVIAHEQAHNSYALLTPEARVAFSAVYAAAKNTDALIRLLYSRNGYGLSNDIEGHAEVYRYIGQHMPESMKQYYPKLFEGAPDPGLAATAQGAPGQKARIIPEPAPGTRTVLDQQALTVAVSSGDVDYLCGSCGVLLLQGMVRDAALNLVVKCPRCGAFNDI